MTIRAVVAALINNFIVSVGGGAEAADADASAMRWWR